MRLRIDFLLSTLALVVAQARAQSGPGQESPDLPDDADRIDEITVVAPKTEMAIRAELIEAEEAMFDIFNSINSDRDFHVVCGWEDRNTGNPTTVSRLKEWQCVSVGERQILSREFGGVAGRDAVYDAMALETMTQGPIRRHREKMRQRMIELAEANPELANAIYRRAALERDLAQARARKRE